MAFFLLRALKLHPGTAVAYQDPIPDQYAVADQNPVPDQYAVADQDPIPDQYAVAYEYA